LGNAHRLQSGAIRRYLDLCPMSNPADFIAVDDAVLKVERRFAGQSFLPCAFQIVSILYVGKPHVAVVFWGGVFG
jgi:hypothetical protein